MSEAYGDEGLVDLSHINYTNDDYEDAVIIEVGAHRECIEELLNSKHTIGSELWNVESGRVFRLILERAKERAKMEADWRHLER